MANIESVELAQLNFAEVVAPATPSAASVVVYAKADGKLYSKDDAGAETLVSGGSGGGTPPVIDYSAGSTSSLMTFADTDMAIAVAASTNYEVFCMVFFNTNATTVGIKLAFNGPASPTLMKIGGYVATGGGGANDSTVGQTSVVAYDTPIVVATSGPGGTNAVAIFAGIFRNGVNAGTLTLRHASETATLTTIEAGSYLKLTAF